MIIVPKPWPTVPPGTMIIDATGRQRPSTIADYPPGMAGAALVCVFTDAELLARALAILLPTFPDMRQLD